MENPDGVSKANKSLLDQNAMHATDMSDHEFDFGSFSIRGGSLHVDIHPQCNMNRNQEGRFN